MRLRRSKPLFVLVLMLLSLFIPGEADACTISWDGGGGNAFWQNRFNWIPDRLPTFTDDVCIGAPAVILSDFGFHHIKSLTASGNLTISTTGLEVDEASSIGGALTLQSNAQFWNDASLTVGGLITIRGSSLNGTGPVDANSGMELEGLVDAFNKTITNRGVATFATSSTRLRMPGGTFNNTSSATFNLGDGVGFDSLGVGSSTFNNAGKVIKAAVSFLLTPTAFGGVRFNNSGIVEAQRGILRFTAPVTQTAGVMTLIGGSIESVSPILVQGGVFAGSGNVTGDMTVAGGSIAPGDAGGIGTIRIAGNFIQETAGTTSIEVDGSASFDRVEITGAATLGGTLVVNTRAGFFPAPGALFRIMTFASRSGSFSSTTATGYTVALNPTDVTLIASEDLPCSYDLSATAFSIGADGGTESVSVRTTDPCAWTASSSSDWIKITSGANGTGAGSVEFSVELLVGPAVARVGTLTVAGKTVTVTQSARPCAYEIVPKPGAFPDTGLIPSRGATVSVLIITGASCTWTAESDDTWISIASSPTGIGSGEVQLTIAANPGEERTGSISVDDVVFEIKQAPRPELIVRQAPIDIPDWCIKPSGSALWTKAFEDGTRLEVVCSSRVLEGEFAPSYKLYFVTSAGAFRIAQCVFANGINGASYRYIDEDRDGVPDRLVSTEWENIDGLKNDGPRSVDGFVFTTKEEDYLDVLRFTFDAATMKLSWRNLKYAYPPGGVADREWGYVYGGKTAPLPGLGTSVDPPVGPETERLFDGLDTLLQSELPGAMKMALTCDVNFDGACDTKDTDLIHSLRGICEGHPDFVPAADLNRDGCITEEDEDIWEPAAQEYRVHGSGYTLPETSKYRATLSLDVTGPATLDGSLKYYYSRKRLNLVGTEISNLTVDAGSATIVGKASVNGTPGFTFTAVITRTSTADFSIQIRRPDGSLLFSAPPRPVKGGKVAVVGR